MTGPRAAVRVVALAAALAVMAGSCRSGDDAAPSAGDTPASPVVVAVGTRPPRTIGGLPVTPLKGAFTYGSVVGLLGGLAYDAEHKRGWLAVRVRNDGLQAAQWSADLALVDAAGRHDGSVEGSIPSLEAGIPLDLTFRIDNLPSVDLASSEIVVGSANKERQVLPQGPDAPDPEHVAFARPIPLTGELRISRWVVTFTGGELLPGRPDGGAADAGQQFVRVHYDLYALAKGGAFGYGPGDNVTIRLPDGTDVESVQDSGGIGPLGRTTSPGLWAVYPVPRTPSGPLRIELATSGHHTLAANPPKTTDMELRLPSGTGTPPDLGAPPAPRFPPLDGDGNLDRTPPSPPDPLTVADGEFVYGDFHGVVHEVRVDAERGTVVLDLDLTYLGHDTSRFLDTPFSLVWGHDAATGGPTKHPALKPGEQGTEVVELRGRLPDQDALDHAFLVVGRGTENRTVLPIGAAAAVAANRMLVDDAPQQGSLTAGSFEVDLLGSSTGSLDASTFGPPRDEAVLEVHVRVTVTADNRDGFGGDGQLLLRLPDGSVLQAAWASSSLGVHDVGTAAEGWVQFRVPAPHGGGYQLVLRSRAEGDLGVTQYDEVAAPLAF